MASGLSDQIVLYLYNDGEPRKEVIYPKLYSQMREMRKGRLSDDDFISALKLLRKKGYILEEAAQYSLSSSGLKYARSLTQDRPTYVVLLLFLLIIACVVYELLRLFRCAPTRFRFIDG